MQYPVPQFTDVEDKLIGFLSFKQFGIIFAAGVVIFVSYSLTKSLIVAAFTFMLIGVPSLGLAFVPFNGRPIYKVFPTLYKFFTEPKYLVFHKESWRLPDQKHIKNLEVLTEKKRIVPKETTKTRLREINALLQKQSAEEDELIKKL